MMRTFLMAGVVGSGLTMVMTAQARTDPATVLAQMRDASGGIAWDGALEILGRGSMKENGFTGQYLLGEDLKSGGYAFTGVFLEGKVKIGSGVHGDEMWSRNQQGTLSVRPDAGKNADAITDTYLYRRAYWQPGFEGAEVTSESPVAEDGVPFDRVRITPSHGKTVVLWINATTHLLDREQRGDDEIRYGDYRNVSELKLPFSIRHMTKEHENFAINLDSSEVKKTLDESDVAIDFYRDFEMPKAGVATVPTERGTIFEARINGKGPFKMLFDTGSNNIISQSVSKELGIASAANVVKLEASNGSIDVRPASVKTLQIGGVTLHDQPFVVMDLPADPGGPVGVVGYEFLQRVVVKIDYDRNQMTMYDPADFRYSGTGAAVSLLMKPYTLWVKATVDGFTGSFALDTGNEVALELSAGFVRTNELVGWTHARFHGYAGSGYAGAMPDAYYARFQKLTIGGAEVDDIAANLSQGEVHEGQPDGNLGQSVLMQFNCTFDISRGNLYLERNAHWGPVPFNRAGIVVDPQDAGMKVMTVLPGEAGESAGLQVGDLITTIDGKPISDSQDESAFVRVPGTVVRLTVKRGGVTREIAVTLRNVL